MGPFGSDIKVEYFEKQGIPVLNGSNIAGVKLKDGFTNFVSHERAKGYKKAVAKRGDIVITHRGTLGQIAYVPDDSEYEEYVISQSQFRVSLKVELINPIYFAYYFHTNEGQKRLLSFKSHVGVPALAQATTNFRLLDFPVRPKREQDAIANVLESIDKKIELNNRINAELEAMAKTLYDYWFVQFDFPDDSPQGQGKPYKTSGGKMVYNPTLKREIPEGWEVDTLSSWIASDKTGDWGKEEQEGNYTLQVDCIRGADINGLNGNGKIAAPNRFILEKNDHKLLAPFDLVIEISGGSPTQSTGRMAYITDDVLDRFTHPLICSNFCKAISLRNKDLFYCFAYLWNDLYGNGVLFGWEGKTSGIKNLLFDSFVTKHQVPIPPMGLAKQFFDFAAPLEQQKQTLLKENARLESLRDWLLPMLMNGQVTVGEAS
ncbi:MAG: restriction endonuclease subunit S [Oceanospirillales bacterium]|nr:MAG: restriction endonuclease subunit S [Oceanospirillales bacterium]